MVQATVVKGRVENVDLKVKPQQQDNHNLDAASHLTRSCRGGEEGLVMSSNPQYDRRASYNAIRAVRIAVANVFSGQVMMISAFLVCA